jgi:ubiquinone/menaquinone biosynthesis C-methylase UbiE
MTWEDTHERILPVERAQSLEDYLVYLKHLALYRFAARYTAQKCVLDLGCGEGYGSDALAHTAHFVVATDRNVEVVLHARQKYTRANLAFVVCDAQALPFRAASFATVVSFEVIEHIPDVRRYLEEIARVSATRGVVLLSTPNRVLRLLPFQKPWNRFHLREYDARGLARAVRVVFPRAQMLGIAATPPILEIEKRRVRQNPFVAYPKMLAQLFIPRAVYEWLKARRAPRVETARSTPFDATRFSVDDFRISADALRECINLVALGEKVTE